MPQQKIVFAQLLEFIPKRYFRRCVDRYRGNHNVRTFTCWEQLVCMMFAQLTGRESLRAIETSLRGLRRKHHLVGVRGRISRSSLADANERRDSRIYADLCQRLMSEARELYSDERFLTELDEVIYVVDSTQMTLCLSLFPWSHFGAASTGFVKVHSVLDLSGAIPTFVAITSAKYPDCKMLDHIPIEPGAFYVMDKAYVDFQRLNNINRAGAYFVSRAKRNLNLKRVSSNAIDKSTGLRCDQVVRLAGQVASRKYSDNIRKISYYDKESERRFCFITNNFQLDPIIIPQLYKSRWQIEIFFKWIKQNLKIKTFYGNSLNAVETQIWIAIATYLLVAIAKKRLAIKTPLYQLIHFFSASLFEKIPIIQGVSEIQDMKNTQQQHNQLDLF